MLPFNILEEKANQVNKISYLSALESSTVLLSDTNELFFGNDENSKIYFGLFNNKQEKISFSIITGSHIPQNVQYRYEDIDGNIFIDQFSYYKNNFIQDKEKNLLIDISESIKSAGNTSSDVFYVLIDPIIDLFSFSSSLLIKEISNSRKEIKLVKNFSQENVNSTVTLSVEGEQIYLNGSTEVNLLKGIVYNINVLVPTDNFEKIAFSLTPDGALFVGGVAYTKNILYKTSRGQIVLDATDESFPSVLYVYNNTFTNSGVKINFLDKIDDAVLKLNTEFLALDAKNFLYKRIYPSMDYYLSSFNSNRALNTAKKENAEKLNSLYTLFNLKSENQLFDLINTIYYGESFFDNKLRKQIKFTGIKEYILNHIKFNYEFIGDYAELSSQINAINVYTVDKWLLLINPNATQTYSDIKLYSDSLSFLTNLFNNFLLLSQIFLKADYIEKFHSPLKTALHFDEENMALLLNSRVDYSDPANLEYVVKLKDPLSDAYDVGTVCGAVNISIEPFFQKINYAQLIQKKGIRLSGPNFSINISDKTSLDKVTKYYTAEELNADYNVNNEILLSKNIKQFNIDYTDFSNFVVFSSAHIRVKIFENKIIKLTLLEQDILDLAKAGNIPPIYTQADGYNNTIQLNVYGDKLEQKNDIINSFDFYESYLYEQYIAGNFVYDINTKKFIEPADVGLSNPRISNYIDELETNAIQYDRQNRDSLISNTPEFISANSDNDEYLKFLSMVGHHFDNIYLYIANFNLYREIGSNIDDGLSRGLLNNILNSFGFKIPPSLSGNSDEADITNTYLSNTYNSGSYEFSLDDRTKIIWKRILTNLPVIYKSKGTQEAIKYILSCYGVPRNLIQIKEFGGGYNRPIIESWNDVSTNVYLLEFTGSNDEYVKIKDIIPHKSVDFKFWLNTSNYSDKSIVQLLSRYNVSGDQVFSLGIIKEKETLGRVYVIFKLGGDEFKYVTDQFYLLSDDIIGVLFRRNLIDSNFESVIDEGIIPTQYDILVCKRSNELTTDSFQYSFYLSSSFNTIFEINNFNIFGNITSSVTGSGTFLDINSIIPGYSVKNFIGALDKFSYNLSPISNNTFYTKNRNIYSYYDGSPSSSYVNSVFNFDLGYPIDISVSSSTANGFLVYNNNINYSYLTASLYNFVGSNYTEIFNTSSCMSQSVTIFPYQTKDFEATIKYDVSGVGPSRLENVKINRHYETRVDNTLSPHSSVSQKESQNYYEDSNKLGIFLAPTDERNKDILDFYGDTNIISSVAYPEDRYSSNFRYKSFRLLRNDFYNYANKYKVLFNELFAIYNIYVDRSIFETLKNVFPARNKVYTGLLIEQTILERTRIPNLPPFVDNINVPTGYIDLRNIINHINGGEFTNLLSTNSKMIKYQYDDSYVENNYYGFSDISDTPDKYQHGLFIESGSGITQYDSDYYYVYLVDVPLKVHYTDRMNLLGTLEKTFKRVELVETASAFNASPPPNYTLYYKNYYNNTSFKPLSFRKEAYPNFNTNVFVSPSPSWTVKSRQTSITTINQSRKTDRSPIISTGTGGVINTGQVGSTSNVGVTTTGGGGSAIITGGGTAGTGGSTGGTTTTPIGVASSPTPTIVR
jgi:hypothetical protein